MIPVDIRAWTRGRRQDCRLAVHPDTLVAELRAVVENKFPHPEVYGGVHIRVSRCQELNFDAMDFDTVQGVVQMLNQLDREMHRQCQPLTLEVHFGPNPNYLPEPGDYVTLAEPQHRRLRIICEDHVRGGVVQALSTHTGVSIRELKRLLAYPVPDNRVQLTSHGKLLLQGPLKDAIGSGPTRVLTLSPLVAGGGKRLRDPVNGFCERCTAAALLVSEGLCQSCAEDDFVHGRRSQVCLKSEFCF